MPRLIAGAMVAAAAALLTPVSAGAAPVWVPYGSVPFAQAFGTDSLGRSFALVQPRFSSTIQLLEREAGPGEVFAPGTELAGNVNADAQLLAEDDGDMLAAWTTSSYDVVFAERPRDGEWSAPVTIPAQAGLLDIDLAANGAAAATWNDAGAWVTWRTGPSTWAPPVQVTASIAGAPRVAVAPDGAVTVVWLQADADHGRVVVQRTKPAGADELGPPQRLSSGAHATNPSLDDGHAHEPDVAIGPGGRAFAAWSHDAGYCTDHANVPQCPGGGSEVEKIEYAERAADSTAFGPTAELAAGQLDLNEHPSLAVGRDGTVSMLFRRDGSPPFDDPEENALVALTRPAGAAGFTRQVLTQQGSGHELVASPAGPLLAIWTQRPGPSSEVTHVAVRRPGAGSTFSASVATSSRTNSGYRMFAAPEGDLLHWNGPLEVLDLAGPRIASFTAPAEIRAGEPADLTVDAVDTWSELESVTWTLPGGATATGPAVQHTFDEAGEHDVVIVAVDVHGNRTERTQRLLVAPPADTAAPVVEIRTPAIGARFTRGLRVEADYSCTDDTVVVSCDGTVADGAPLDTGTVGSHWFRVVARDAAGHETVRVHGYFVDPAPTPDPGPAPGGPGSGTPGPVSGGGPAAGSPGAAGGAAGNAASGAGAAGPSGGGTPTGPDRPLSEVIAGDAERNGAAAPPAVSGRELLGEGLTQIIGATEPGTTIIGQISGVISAGGGNVISAGGGNVISAGGGNVISAGGGNVISAGGGNVISAGALNLKARAAVAGQRARRKGTQVLLARGGHTFTEAGTATLHVRLTKRGQRLVAAERRRARRAHRQGRPVADLRLAYTLITGRADGGTPAYVSTRTVTIDLLHRHVQTQGPRAGLGYDIVRRGGRKYRRYENGDVVPVPRAHRAG